MEDSLGPTVTGNTRSNVLGTKYLSRKSNVIGAQQLSSSTQLLNEQRTSVLGRSFTVGNHQLLFFVMHWPTRSHLSTRRWRTSRCGHRRRLHDTSLPMEIGTHFWATESSYEAGTSFKPFVCDEEWSSAVGAGGSVLRHHVDGRLSRSCACRAVVSHLRPPLRRGHGCTVCVLLDAPVWCRVQGDSVSRVPPRACVCVAPDTCPIVSVLHQRSTHTDTKRTNVDVV